MKRKGIILAGGIGTRLYPATQVVSKQLLPVFDKPLVYYSLTTLMLTDVREVLVICKPQDISCFKQLLADGNQWGLDIEYAVQPSPNGLAQALIIAEDFLNGVPSVLILGDNIFYGSSLQDKLRIANQQTDGAVIFAYCVHDPERYGIVEFDKSGTVIGLEEKSLQPKSNYAVTGLYFYDKYAPQYAKQIKPSNRGELEITDLNKFYLEKGHLSVQKLSCGHTWFDAGTHRDLAKANQFVWAVEHYQGLKIACPEEIAFRQGWITQEQLEQLAQPMLKSDYGKYLMQLLEN